MDLAMPEESCEGYAASQDAHHALPLRSSSSASDSTIGAPTPEEDTTSRVIDPRGDLFLNLSYGEHSLTLARWLVNSSCLRLASSKFAQLIDTLPAATQGSRRQLSIEHNEDCTEILTWILQAAHCQHDEVPERIEFAHLIHVAHLYVEYDLAGLLKPYIKKWIFPWLSKLGEPKYEEWLFVAFHLGYRKLFEDLSTILALQMEYIDNEYVIGELCLHDSKLNGAILDNLIRIRTEYLEAAIAKCYEILDDYSAEQPWCCSEAHASECMATVLGSLAKGLKACGVWPNRPKAQHVRQSANDFRASLGNIAVFGYPNHEHYLVDYDGLNFRESIYRSSGLVRGIENDSECDAHFQIVPAEPWWRIPLTWERGATAWMGYTERDFEPISSDDELDEDYDPGEGEPAEPGEEWLSTDAESEYGDEDGDASMVDV